MPKPGIVYLVGAGPGDPGLITVKGLACLRQAEVVLYDRLVAPQLLGEAAGQAALISAGRVAPELWGEAPAEAELIDVGKAPTRHRRSQDEINQLLLEKAAEGKR